MGGERKKDPFNAERLQKRKIVHGKFSKSTRRYKIYSLHSECYSLVAFLDVSAAYDNVQFHILIERLRILECPNNILKYINNWLKDRHIEYIISQKEKVSRIARKGLPQGAVLSPLLYAMYTNEITASLENEVRVLQFADDIAVYVCGGDRRHNRDLLEQAVNQIAVNLEKLGLDLEPRKTI